MFVGSGNDALDGDNKDNLLWAGAGDDTLLGRGGNDRFLGEAGTDTVDYSYLNKTQTIEVELHRTKVLPAEAFIRTGDTIFENDLLQNIENLVGGAGNDALTGNGFENALNGGPGNDSLSGKGGNDLLAGRLGLDTLEGGAGSDQFMFNTAPNSDTNWDEISDFSQSGPRGEDFIVLSKAVFAGVRATGANDPRLLDSMFHLGTEAGAGNAGKNDFILYDQETGRLAFDPDGNLSAASVLIATLTPGTELNAFDILLVA